jgi:hypothetical protein
MQGIYKEAECREPYEPFSFHAEFYQLIAAIPHRNKTAEYR